MKFRVSESSHKISPEKVSKNNSNLWRYSPEISSALRKENYSKAIPEAYLAYKSALGELDLVSPYEEVDLKMDLEKFKGTLNLHDKLIFNLALLGMNQADIAAELKCSQSFISKRLSKIKNQFKTFYEG